MREGRTSIQLDKKTLSLLNECKGIEAQRRGESWMKHDDFIRFACYLYKEIKDRPEFPTAAYLARRKEQEVCD